MQVSFQVFLDVARALTLATMAQAPSVHEPSAPGSSVAGERRTVVVDTGQGEGQDEQRELDAETPGFSTAIDLEDPAGARPTDSLPELLTRAPGVTVRSLGGLGQFSAVSLRGSTSQQVAVFLDGVPITDSVGGLVNVGDLPLDGLRRVDVYRGHVPVAFGSAAMGGALNLVSTVPHDEHQVVSAATGYGSFSARQGSLSFRGPLTRSVGLTAHAGYAGAKGDFPYFDDGNTPQTPEDDTTAVRTNNGYDRVLGQVGLGARHGHWHVRAQQWALWKTQGVPGTASVQSRHAGFDTLTLRTTLSVSEQPMVRPGGRLEWLASVGANRRTFADPANEVGSFADDELTWAVDGYLSPRLRLPLWRGAFLGLVGEHRTEWVRVDERSGAVTQASGDSVRRRHGYGFGLELEQSLFDDRWLVVPVFRVDALDSRFEVPAGQGELSDAGQDSLKVGWAPRLGTRVRVVRGLELRASAGRYFRPPTLLELFGDRGYIIGNEGLIPERGTSVDGGLVLDFPELRWLSVYGQATAFASWAEDLIQWVQAGTVTRSENVADARVWGVETSLAVDALSGLAKVQGNYTLLVTENRSPEAEQRGKPLPGRPRHEVFGRVSSGFEFRPDDVAVEPRVFYTVEFVAGTFLDPSGRRQVPARTIHGLGAELHLLRQVHLAVEVRNLLDRRVTTWNPPIQGVAAIPVPLSDFIGFPLPGRSVWATLRVDLYPARNSKRSKDRSRSGAT